MGYCDKEFDRMVDQQSMEADPAKRKKLVWDIDHKLQEDLARPVIYHLRAATCWQPEVKGLTMMTTTFVAAIGVLAEAIFLARGPLGRHRPLVSVVTDGGD